MFIFLYIVPTKGNNNYKNMKELIKMNMSEKEYGEYVKKKTKNSPIFKNCINAFLFGGAICTLGQVIFNIYNSFGWSEKNVALATSVTLIFLGALLTGLDIYPKLAKRAGAGTVVPITGFANSVVSPAIESKTEGYVLGVGAKIFTIAGPVILYGTLASVICGIVYYIGSLM